MTRVQINNSERMYRSFKDLCSIANIFEIFIGSFFVTFVSEVLWGFLSGFGILCNREASNSPRLATQWTDNLPRDATMIYFLYSVMLKFGTKHFGFIISFITARWIGKKKREKLEGKQTGSLPWSLLIPRAYECYCCASRCKDATIKCHSIFTRRLFSIISMTILYLFFTYH